jgi:hypothetical protein
VAACNAIDVASITWNAKLNACRPGSFNILIQYLMFSRKRTTSRKPCVIVLNYTQKRIEVQNLLDS